MHKKIKIAQIGTGHDHASATYNSLRKLTDDYEVIGVAEPVENHRSNLVNRGEYRDTAVYPVEQLLDMDLDAVAIETDEEYATSYAQMFADRGTAIHMDKPGSHGTKSFAVLAETLSKQNLPLQLGYMYRYNPLVIRAMEEVRAGALGEIYAVEAQMSVRHSVEKRNWLGKYRGGMLYFLGCHLIDLVYQLQGEPVSVQALSRPVAADGVAAEDYGFALLEYRNGVSFVKTCAAEWGGFARRQLVICGTKGTIELKPLEEHGQGGQYSYGYYTHAGNEKSPWADNADRWVAGPYDRYDAMMADFAAIVRGEKENPWSLEYETNLFRLIMRCCGAVTTTYGADG